ncbi:TPA: ATP-binding protein, partial [Candidatus Micrarchaeota archaeon]|nr:ATP-binding protein [Candidatus Micrarchaeota archaeon]
MDDNLNFEQLRLLSLSLAKSVDGLKRRSIVKSIVSSLDSGLRIKIVRGFRGVGKTTAMLHAFAEVPVKSVYFSVDNPAIKSRGVYNSGIDGIKQGYFLLFIDEVHTYPNWRVEIKALHDANPTLKIVASGSAPIALVPERREELVCMHPMNFSEFINLKKGETISCSEEWRDKDESITFVATTPALEGEFYKYIRVGGFPLSIGLDENKALEAIYYSIKKSIRDDAVFFLKMSKEKIFAMENLIIFIATSKPGELSLTSLSSTLHVSKTVVYEIIDALERMEIIRVIRPFARGSALVRSEPKILFFHPNMRFAVCQQLGGVPDKGAIREELAVFGFSERGWTVHTIKGEKKSPDYVIEKSGKRLVVEIGGEKKSRKQL